ncbi:MAG: cytochrome c [bacterium]|nr:cytochrome c [bacterium]
MRIYLQWLGVSIVALIVAIASLGCDKPATSGNSGEQLFAANRCATCHGDALDGKLNLGPALGGLKANWKSADELSKYLANPAEYALGDQRLREQMSKYSMKMPAMSMTDEERDALAKWLLK